MESFGNIKVACDLLSKIGAPAFFAERLGEEFPGDTHDEVNPFEENEKEMNEILKKSELFGVQGPVKSGTFDKEGKWVSFIALIQTFNKDAPNLKNLLNKLSKCFKIETIKDGKLNVIDSSDETSPDTIDIANYIVSSANTYALNLSSKKIMNVKARQKGSASKTDYGVIVELNIEVPPNVNSIAEKLVLLKLPEDDLQKEKKAGTITSEVTEVLRKQGYNDFLNDQSIKEERNKAIKAFETLDKDLEQLMKA